MEEGKQPGEVNSPASEMLSPVPSAIAVQHSPPILGMSRVDFRSRSTGLLWGDEMSDEDTQDKENQDTVSRTEKAGADKTSHETGTAAIALPPSSSPPASVPTPLALSTVQISTSAAKQPNSTKVSTASKMASSKSHKAAKYRRGSASSEVAIITHSPVPKTRSR